MTKKFEITCKKCKSKNVEVTLKSIGSRATEEDELSEWIELECKNCNEHEEVQER